MWIGTAAQCRALDKAVIADFGITSEDLMERAGETAAAVVKELSAGGPVLVLCGIGNNGGDGLVLARLLKLEGSPVKVYVAGPMAKMSELGRQMLAKARFAGVTVCFFGEDGWGDLTEDVEDSELIVDALLGIGQKGEPKGAIKEAVLAIHDAYASIVSIDVPTGIDADTGTAFGVYVDADVTVSFGMAKPCFFQGIGAEACGDWRVEDIGYPEEALREAAGIVALDEPLVIEALGTRPVASHKGSNGHVLIVAGSARMRGAAVLAAQGALRSGAGRVTVASVSSVCEAVAASVPEAMLFPLEDDEGMLCDNSASLVLAMQPVIDCAVFGPGLSVCESVREFLQNVWEAWTVPSVIDADALNAVGLGLALPRASCVLTPHPGEMARLMATTIDKVQSDRFATVREATKKYRSTVVLKGAYSLTCAPEEKVSVNLTGNPGMASPGMGDVLSGVIGGLIAQGLPVPKAAAVGAYLHGLAGNICSEESGPIGFLASDVAAALPSARAKLDAWYQE